MGSLCGSTWHSSHCQPRSIARAQAGRATHDDESEGTKGNLLVSSSDSEQPVNFGRGGGVQTVALSFGWVGGGHGGSDKEQRPHHRSEAKRSHVRREGIEANASLALLKATRAVRLTAGNKTTPRGDRPVMSIWRNVRSQTSSGAESSRQGGSSSSSRGSAAAKAGVEQVVVLADCSSLPALRIRSAERGEACPFLFSA